MTLFGHGTGGVLDSHTSPVLSPSRWVVNGRRPTQYGASDLFSGGEQTWQPSRRRYADDSRYHSDLLHPSNSRFDGLGRNFDALPGSTPEMRALRSRIMDSPSHTGALDLPAYLRSTESRKLSHTPKRASALRQFSNPSRRTKDFLNDDLGFKFNSPLLSGNRRTRSRSRGLLPELKIGTYTPNTQDRFGDSKPLFPDRKYDVADLYKTSPVKNRINIHATDDILNRIKRGLSECENISKRLDRQYGERGSHAPPLDYSERVFPRVLADNLFTSRNNAGSSYRSKLNAKRSNLLSNSDDALHMNNAEKEQPKSTLTRILDNIKRIRNKALFSDADDSNGKRKFVEVEKGALGPSRLNFSRSKTLDVDAIQQRIKQQKRNLMSQRNLPRFD